MKKVWLNTTITIAIVIAFASLAINMGEPEIVTYVNSY